MSDLLLIEGSATRWRMRCGEAALTIDRSRGGCAVLSHGEARVALGVRVVVDAPAEGEAGGTGREAGQSHDPDARIVPLEQAAGLAGVRAEFGLFDGERHIGEGFTEYWLAEGGQLTVSCGIRVADAAVRYAGLEARAEGAWTPQAQDTEVLLLADGGVTVGIESSSAVYRSASALELVRTRPPFYRRWMSYLDQWSLDPSTEGFDRDPSGGPAVSPADGAVTVDLAWRRPTAPDAGTAARPGGGLTARGAVLVAIGGAEGVRAALSQRREPLAVAVSGDGVAFHEASNGTVAVAASGSLTSVEVPADPSARPLHVRVDGLRGAGGIRVASTAPMGVALVSGRGRVDDPLVGLIPPSGAPADQAVVSLRARPDAPVRIDVEEVDGLHAAVQRLDDDRRITVHHPADPLEPVLAISTARLRLSGLRLPGRDVALHDLPLHWLRYLAKSAAHVTDHPVAVAVEDWGPEQVVVRIDGSNADGSVASSCRLVIPHLAERIEVAVESTLHGASRWGLDCAEYTDVFPEAGIDPGRWRYESVALLRAAGDHILDTREPYPGLDRLVRTPVHALEAFQARVDAGGFGPWRMAQGDAVLLHGAQAGDVLMVLDGASPHDLGHVATYCEHWADVHLDVVRGGGFPTPSELPPGAPTLLPDHIVARYRLIVREPADGGLDAAIARARDLDI